MIHGPEPRFARVAAMIGDPTRARMLALLLGNPCATAGEVARCAGVTPQTASAHLAKMMREELIVARRQGRHRYFRLANDEVAHALEALSVVAERRAVGARAAQWARDAYRPLRAARTCYGHLAGRLGVALHDHLLESGYLTLAHERYRLTGDGRTMLEELGLEGERFERARQPLVYPCLDWSERRDHFAGPLAVALLEHFLRRRWLRHVDGTRAVVPTPAGQRALAGLLGAAPNGHPALR